MTSFFKVFDEVKKFLTPDEVVVEIVVLACPEAFNTRPKQKMTKNENQSFIILVS
jgi:hypothetical protein